MLDAQFDQLCAQVAGVGLVIGFCGGGGLSRDSSPGRRLAAGLVARPSRSWRPLWPRTVLGRSAAARGLRRVAVETVAEAVAEAAQGALERVRHGALERRLVALSRLVGDRLEANVGARGRARHSDSHDRRVSGAAGDFAGARVGLLELAQGHIADQLVAPAAVAEDLVGLVDRGVTLDVRELASAASLALRDQRRVERLRQRLCDESAPARPSAASPAPTERGSVRPWWAPRRSVAIRCPPLGPGAGCSCEPPSRFHCRCGEFRCSFRAPVSVRCVVGGCVCLLGQSWRPCRLSRT